jgi:hypothetical protein
MLVARRSRHNWLTDDRWAQFAVVGNGFFDLHFV